MEILYQHQKRNHKDNTLCTVTYGIKSGYFFIEVVDSKDVTKFSISSDEWINAIEDVMRDWGVKERIIIELSEIPITK